MPIAYKIYDSYKLCYSVWTGKVSPDEVLSFHHNMYQNPKWKPGFNEVVDVRNIELKSANIDDLFTLSKTSVDYTHGKCESFKTAVVVTDIVIEGLAETYKTLLLGSDSPEELEVFLQLEEALDWLGLDQNSDISPPGN
ncbi:MAG TPA: hypothetical protein VKA23_03215 [Mariprofundaceae bacterium]|nr:hypothetical protein [Mariprofundaceae bacterium]